MWTKDLLFIERNAILGCVCMCASAVLELGISRPGNSNRITPLPLSPSLFASVSLQAQNVLGTALLPWASLLSPSMITSRQIRFHSRLLSYMKHRHSAANAYRTPTLFPHRHRVFRVNYRLLIPVETLLNGVCGQ